MKRKLLALLAALVICLNPIIALADTTAAQSPYIDGAADEKPLLLYFFENYCDSCKPEQEFADSFNGLTGKNMSDYRYRYYNVKLAADREAYEQAIKDYNIPADEQYLPMAIVDGVVYAGNSKIESAMPAAFTANESTDSVMYYLYSPSCESCAEAKATLDGLPETITVHRGSYEFESKINIIRINIYDQPGVAKALFDKYNVPEDKQVTPILFLRDMYLNGAERINRMLDYSLRNAQAVGTAMISDGGAAQSDTSSLTWAGTFMAGLVAGFNPCALSMLLFFLTLLLPLRKNAGRSAAVYLISKFCMYLLIGTVLLTAFSAWNPTWLPMVAKILLTAIGGVLVVLNLMDARAAHREKYGEIKNQLPRGMRKFLHGRIKKALENPGKGLIPSIILLGLIVASSEFLCSGQLYLATLTAGLEMGIEYFKQFMLLVVFCLAFLLPSIVLTVLVIKGRDMFGMSDAMLRRMPAIKIATAVVMAAIIVVAWVL